MTRLACSVKFQSPGRQYNVNITSRLVPCLNVYLLTQQFHRAPADRPSVVDEISVNEFFLLSSFLIVEFFRCRVFSLTSFPLSSFFPWSSFSVGELFRCRVFQLGSFSVDEFFLLKSVLIGEFFLLSSSLIVEFFRCRVFLLASFRCRVFSVFQVSVGKFVRS